MPTPGRGGYTGTEEEFAAKLAEGPLIGTTTEITPTQVADAIAAGRDVAIAHTGIYGRILFTHFGQMDAFDAIASSAVLDYDGMQIVLALFGQLSTNQWFMPNPVTLATKSDIPSALPNPEYLTFKPGTNILFTELVPISYSGESAQTVYLPTKTSHLENDSGFLTAAPVTSVNGQTGAVQITIPAALKNPSALTINGSGTAENNLLSTFYTMETLGDDYFRLVPVDAGGGKWKAQANVASVTDAEFFRISLAGSGENLIVTVDEPIEE